MNRKAVSLLSGILAVTIVMGGCSAETSSETEAEIPAVSEIQPVLPHPLSIPGLREKVFEAVDFTLLEPVSASEGLSAREFSYRSEGLLNYGLIEQPEGESPENGWPVIVLAHGFIPPESYSTRENYRLVSRYFAAGGFMVVKPDYRSHGRSEGPAADSNVTRTVDYSIDVMNLIAGLESITDADTDNIFLYGHSMGGEIGLRVLTVNDSLKGASLWAGVTEDYPENTLYFVRKKAPGSVEAHKKLVAATFKDNEIPTITPNNYLDSIEVPLFIHHGTEDESVPFEWSIPFRERLDAAGVEYTFFEYPGENHNISRSFYKVMDKDMEFFRTLIN